MHVVVGIDIVVDWNDVLRQTSIRRFRAHKSNISFYRSLHISDPVLPYRDESTCWYGYSSQSRPTSFITIFSATLRLFPGIAIATVSAFLMPPIRGVVLETFGAGNAPQRADLMQALKEACDRGVVVVAITQCVKGSVSDAYETGRTLLQAGIVSGGDMTPEVRRILTC